MAKITEGIDSKIDEVYKRVKEMKLTFDPSNTNKKALSDRTIRTYRDVVKAYNSYLKETHEISIDRAKPRHAYEFLETRIKDFKENGKGSAFSMRQFAHALHSFQVASKDTGVFKHHCKVGDKRVMLGNLTEQGVLRKSEDSTCLKATGEDFQKVHSKLDENGSSMKEYTKTVHEMQRFIGCRVSEAVKMKAKDIDFNTGKITIKGKGGLVRTVVCENKELLSKLQELSSGQGANTPVLMHRNQQGEQLSTRELTKRVEKQIRDAAVKAEVDREDKKYTTHSARKAYAQSQMDKYANLSKTQLKKALRERCEEDTKIAKKYEQALKNVRKKIKDPNKKAKRKLNEKELATLLTSLDLGHYRTDVVRFYATYKTPSK